MGNLNFDDKTIHISANTTTCEIARSCCICGDSTENIHETVCKDCKNAILRLKKEFKLLDSFVEDEREKVNNNENDV